jgi:hypothetical protein
LHSLGNLRQQAGCKYFKMQRLILGLLIVFSSCRMAKPTNVISLNNVEINIRLKSCIDIFRRDTVTFLIQNRSNQSFWIDSWHLMLDSVKTKNNEIVIRDLVEYRHPPIPEFKWIPAESQIRISYLTDFFLQTDLSKLQNYTLYGSYNKEAIPFHKVKGKVLGNTIKAVPKKFWTCP